VTSYVAGFNVETSNNIIFFGTVTGIGIFLADARNDMIISRLL